MKASCLCAFAALARYVASSSTPLFYSDPKTTSDCVEWFDNDVPEERDSTCEALREIFQITPEQFHAWNPSVSLDCESLKTNQSYCIVTQEILDYNDQKPWPTPSTVVVTTATTATSSFTRMHSPTAWTEMGCYINYSEEYIMAQTIYPHLDGSESLTIEQCQETCYRRSCEFAGVSNGTQCGCSHVVGGITGARRAADQSSCNMTCSGDSNTICGGKDFMNVFKAGEEEDSAVWIYSEDMLRRDAIRYSANSTDGFGESTTRTSLPAATSSSAATRNRPAMLWK